MEQSAKVSVIIPTRNRCSLLLETLESVRRQSYESWEAVVVDDGSTDGTAERMGEVTRQEARIRFLEASKQRPAGANACRNEGVGRTDGEYVIFLDSDDLLAPYCLSQRVEAMQQRPELDFGVFACQVFARVPGDMGVMWNIGATEEDDLDRFLRVDVPWQTTGPIWRRSGLNRLDRSGEASWRGSVPARRPLLWDENLQSWQDWEFHIRAIVEGLRYDRLGRRDCYWRAMGGHASIGTVAFTVPHLRSRKFLIERLARLLEQRNLLNDRRRIYLAGLYFHNAEKAGDEISVEEGIRFWQECRRLGLVSHRLHSEVMFYLRWRHMYRVRRLMWRLLSHRWPELTLVGHSPTHVKAPLVEESDESAS